MRWYKPGVMLSALKDRVSTTTQEVVSFLHVWGLLWSNVSKFMRLRISQLYASIPLIGYLLLWSEKLEQFFILQKALVPGSWFSSTTRLQLIYYGAICFAVAWALFQRCPAIIKRHPYVEDYLFEQASINDKFALREVFRQVRTYFTGEQGQEREWASQVPVTVQRAMKPEQLRAAWANANDEENRSTVHKAYYLYQETHHLWALLPCAQLILAGLGLVLLPSLEVFVLVTSHFLLGK
jgi:hypothetical protein